MARSCVMNYDAVTIQYSIIAGEKVPYGQCVWQCVWVAPYCLLFWVNGLKTNGRSRTPEPGQTPLSGSTPTQRASLHWQWIEPKISHHLWCLDSEYKCRLLCWYVVLVLTNNACVWEFIDHCHVFVQLLHMQTHTKTFSKSLHQQTLIDALNRCPYIR